MQLVGQVKELWRYPVKSMVGESIQEAMIESKGMRGDRSWTIRDDSTNENSIVRKNPKLLQCKAAYVREPDGKDVSDVRITMPNGMEFLATESDSAKAIAELLGKPVSLWSQQPKTALAHYKANTSTGAQDMKRMFASKELPDFSSITWGKLIELMMFTTPLGYYYDVYPLHVLTTASLDKMNELEPAGDFCAERFRPNILIESLAGVVDFEEFMWVGGTLHIGEVVIHCISKTVRCSAPAQPQAHLGKDGKVVKAIDKHTNRYMGINTNIVTQGNIKVGDNVYWQPTKTTVLGDWASRQSGKLKNVFLHRALNLVDKFK